MAHKSVGRASEEIGNAIKVILEEYLPQTKGMGVEVVFYENDRKKRRDAPRDSWKPAHGEIRIAFGLLAPAQETSQPDSEAGECLDSPETGETGKVTDTLIESLNQTENRPSVVSVLGDRDVGPPAFSPIDIQGEPLSETVLQDRR